MLSAFPPTILRLGESSSECCRYRKQSTKLKIFNMIVLNIVNFIVEVGLRGLPNWENLLHIYFVSYICIMTPSKILYRIMKEESSSLNPGKVYNIFHNRYCFWYIYYIISLTYKAHKVYLSLPIDITNLKFLPLLFAGGAAFEMGSPIAQAGFKQITACGRSLLSISQVLRSQACNFISSHYFTGGSQVELRDSIRERN